MSKKEVSKVSEEHLEKLTQANTNFVNAQRKLGELEMQKYKIHKSLEIALEGFKYLEKELIEEYGDDVVINLESGEIKPAEKKEK